MGRPATRLLGLLLLTMFVSCGGDSETEARHDLRPLWQVGESYEVRVERKIWNGLGNVPPAGELGSRARDFGKTVDRYRETVLAADRTRLVRTLRNCVHSFREVDGVRKDTEVTGKTFEIEDPLGEFRVLRVQSDGSRVTAEKEEMQYLRATSLLLGWTLLPEAPVAEGATWAPTRDLSGIAKVGDHQMGVDCRLKSISETKGIRTAEVEGFFRGQIRRDGKIGARTFVREVLRIDVTSRAFRSYRSTTEIHFPPPSTPKGRWRRGETSLSVEQL